MIKIAMIIAPVDFRDEEYFIPKSIFINNSFNVVPISSKKGNIVGVYGGVEQVSLLLNDLDVKDYSAVIFVGGSGAMNFIDNKQCHKIARETVKNNKILGAICLGPSILARAKILKGKKATVWSSKMDKTYVKILKQEGAVFENNPVVVDENIITANGPKSARKFAETIVEHLKQN